MLSHGAAPDVNSADSSDAITVSAAFAPKATDHFQMYCGTPPPNLTPPIAASEALVQTCEHIAEGSIVARNASTIAEVHEHK